MKRRLSTVLATVLCLAIGAPALAAAPDKPDTVRTKRLSKTRVEVTWRDRSSNEDGFEILRREPPDGFEIRGTVGPNQTSFVDEDSPRGRVFIYRVRAFNEDGDSDLSGDCFSGKTPPPVPLSFKVRLIALTVVRVSWSDRSNQETGFLIQRREEGKGYQTIAIVDPNKERFEDDQLEPTKTYTYRMRALGRPARCIAHSKFTSERTVTTKGGLKVLTIERTGNGTGKVTSIPDGISCGPQANHCSAEFPIGADVTLVAEPNSKSRFKSWIGIPRCTKEKGPCSFSMGRDRVVGVRFKKKRGQ